ncbi:hypothetical protein FRC03_008949 [Tulasnella sp. 419]|nr:hypothetical protein FRC03_008949 [Tulasnella sp. 419]
MDNIKQELAHLRQRIQICHQKLQLSSTTRTEAKIEAVHHQMAAQESSTRQLQSQLQMIIEELIPRMNQKRSSSLDTIKPEINNRPEIIINGSSAKQDVGDAQTESGSESTSIRSTRLSIKSFASSLIERRYLSKKVKELIKTLSRVRDRVSMLRDLNHSGQSLTVQVWEMEHIPHSREDIVREILQMLAILRSGEELSNTSVATTLLGLAWSLGDFGMWEEAGVIYDWATPLCCEIARLRGPKTLFSFANFITRTFMDLARQGMIEDATRILNRAGKLWWQLEQQDQVTFLWNLARSLEETSEASKWSRFLEA